MAVRMSKPWLALDEDNVNRVTSHLGVYQLAGDDEAIVYIGVAGGRSTHGLKGELRAHLAHPAGATRFRYEINMSYRSRHFELLQAYRHDHGRLPAGNTDVDVERLGRLRPS